jgi:hypothetical protein
MAGVTSVVPRGLPRALIGALALVAAGLLLRTAAAAPRPLWSFHAGAQLSTPPGLGPDGGLVFGTVDGYVHALRPDGVFRYSYTLEGRVLPRPIVFSDGLVLVASGAGKLYAIKPDGSLLWETAVAGGVVSPLAIDDKERVWLRTGSGTAVAYSRRGSIVGFAKIGRTATLGPTPIAGQGVLVGEPEGTFTLIGELGKTRRFHAVFESSVVAVQGGFAGLGQGSLFSYGESLSVAWNHSGVEKLLCASPLVALHQRELLWLAPDGRVEASVRAENGLEGTSVCRGSSVFAVDAGGQILELRPGGAVTPIDRASGEVLALEATVPGALVVAYRDGRVVALKVTP